METYAPIRQPNATIGPIVAFDFDGTLTFEDSFATFLAWQAGPARHAYGMARLIPAAIRYGVDRDRGRLKAAAVHEYLGGVSRDWLADRARACAAVRSCNLLRPDAVACWNEWRARGARLVIVTASPEITVAPFARALGADDLIGTRLAFDDQDRVTGALDGANCRGPEKIIRLKQVFGADVELAAAYGDSDGDTEMLAFGKQSGLRVFTARP